MSNILYIIVSAIETFALIVAVAIGYKYHPFYGILLFFDITAFIIICIWIMQYEDPPHKENTMMPVACEVETKCSDKNSHSDKSRVQKMEIECASRTHIGGRDENQDYSGAWDGEQEHYDDEEKNNYEWSFSSNKSCGFVVADGLGGHQGGGKASKLAVKSILEYFRDNITKAEDIETELENAIIKAHKSVIENQKTDPLLEDMKTTCVALIISGEKAYWLTIGDSRLYIFRDGYPFRKSRDHSVVQMLLDMKEISEKDVQGHPDRNRVLKTLGMDEELQPKVYSAELKKDDHILICTDGLWEYFLESELNDIINKKNTAREIINTLFAKAILEAEKTNEKYDNLTAQVIVVK